MPILHQVHEVSSSHVEWISVMIEFLYPSPHVLWRLWFRGYHVFSMEGNSYPFFSDGLIGPSSPRYTQTATGLLYLVHFVHDPSFLSDCFVASSWRTLHFPYCHGRFYSLILNREEGGTTYVCILCCRWVLNQLFPPSHTLDHLLEPRLVFQ